MRRLRVNATMRAQLTDLREAKTSRRRGGVMTIPKMLSVAEWEAQAMASQEALIAAARDDPNARVAIEVPEARDITDVTDRYRPSVPTPVDTRPLEARVDAERKRYAEAAYAAATMGGRGARSGSGVPRGSSR